MPTSALPPLLLLDVDGPLNAFERDPQHLPADSVACPCIPTWIAKVPREPGAQVTPLQIYLRRSHGPSLQELGFELCWATAWMSEANQWISPALGLPSLPFIDFGTDLFTENPDGVHWKTRKILRYARGRTFAWVDDELSNADRTYVSAHHDAPALLHHVDPAIGLTEEDLGALRTWAAALQ
ncbi:hypothetical protein ACIHFE_33780 [Streptomyces sp. NPDC052396]|uniref:hypothetical protein n=1 Tax=Streptomyces sp. NPDC052396 TaxID=3365689 RepID=UPI0037D835C1